MEAGSEEVLSSIAMTWTHSDSTTHHHDDTLSTFHLQRLVYSFTAHIYHYGRFNSREPTHQTTYAIRKAYNFLCVMGMHQAGVFTGFGRRPREMVILQRSNATLHFSYHCLILRFWNKATAGTEIGLHLGYPRGMGTELLLHVTLCLPVISSLFSTAFTYMFSLHLYPPYLLYHSHSYLHGLSALNTQLPDSFIKHLPRLKTIKTVIPVREVTKKEKKFSPDPTDCSAVLGIVIVIASLPTLPGNDVPNVREPSVGMQGTISQFTYEGAEPRAPYWRSFDEPPPTTTTSTCFFQQPCPDFFFLPLRHRDLTWGGEARQDRLQGGRYLWPGPRVGLDADGAINIERVAGV